jgi:transcriptional regulator with PAS, ATPase and Fis domain
MRGIVESAAHLEVDSVGQLLIGRSPQIAALRQEIESAARSEAAVLITGESGVGKESVAHSIHARSPRASMPFEAVNCASLPESQLEAELFGHVEGSFASAYRDKRHKPGKLEAARHGTLFLDEIGRMTLRMQGLLRRFLETNDLRQESGVGADGVGRRVDIRVIAATNLSLRDMIPHGTFREDLYHRLNVVQIAVPPLRERRDDIPVLLAHFLGQFVMANRSPISGLSPEAMQALMEYPWPGNVREVENLVERMVVSVTRSTVDVDDLPSEIRLQGNVALRRKRERRRTIADDLYQRLVEQRESFWATVYPMYMGREITRVHVRDIVGRGLEESRGNYRILARLFNMESRDYKRFLNFLRKHDCQLPFKEYR